MRIACWSGPRNISTALMRSWSSRDDTFVSDEPFYGYYLKEKKLKHPMYKEIIKHYPITYGDVVKQINMEVPNSRKIWYQKHMSHHIINLDDISWIKKFENCILIRHPRYVINSYIKKNELYHADELGYPQQYRIIKFLKNINKKFFVIESSELLDNPEKILSKWCNKINITFDKSMLKWEKGNHPNDGIWWKHWYDNVINTDKFSRNITKDISIQKKYEIIYKECMFFYDKILAFKE